MSYYGYPNPAYGANYSAAYYGASLEQYTAAYNAAAYQAMQQQQQQQSTKSTTGASISQPAQRYDPAAAAAYYANYPKPPQQPVTPSMAKWPPATPALPFTTTPGQLVGGQLKSFKPRRPAPNNTPVQQVFYCEICKVSCAGPQTYKEHLEGQKHKKREKMQPSLNTSSVSTGSGETVANIDQTGTSFPSTFSDTPDSSKNSIKPTNKHVINCPLCEVACTGRDAYAAHLRGSKHQKTLKLHQKLGKPIPIDLLNPSPTSVTSTPTVQQTTTTTTPIKLIPTDIQPNTTAGMPVSAAAASTIVSVATTSVSHQSAPIPDVVIVDNVTNNDLSPDEDANCEPVGKEYLETRVNGKVVSFYCKLCDCSFNDPNAKEMHTKGKRHRLAYKKKVDPNLKIDLKTISSRLKNTKNAPNLMLKTKDNKYTLKNGTGGGPSLGESLGGTKSLMDDIKSQNIQSLMSQPVKPNLQGNQYMPNMPMRHFESFDDKHVIAKHNSIYPTPDEINAIHEVVSSTEKALKLVSDQIAEEDNAVAEIKVENGQTEQTVENGDTAEAKKPVADRALKGVMRVGLLAKNLLLRGDTDVKLIVVCSNKPTRSLLDRVHTILTEKIKIISPDVKYSIIIDKEAETIVLVRMTITELEQPLITCKVLLTSPAVRDEVDDAANSMETSPAGIILFKNHFSRQDASSSNGGDLLNKQRCLASLAELRHAKWFQAKASQTNNCVLVIRVFRDLCRRNVTWSPLSQWALELLVEKSLSSYNMNQKLSQGESFRRVLECISSGVLLPSGPGIYDPCELEPTDATENLTSQQREDLTTSAHVALRLLAFKQIYKILGMESLNSQNASKYAKKRQLETSELEAESDSKKEKREGEDASEEQSDESVDQVVADSVQP